MLKKLNIVLKLVILNTAVFVLFNLIHLGFYLFNADESFNSFVEFFTVPSNLKQLLFHFWTPITYMFLHVDFWHIFGNMLWLFFIGRILIEYIKEKDFVTLYLLGGLSGAAMYILAFNIFPVFSDVKIFSTALGASASVTAIVIALATYKPDKELYLFGLVKIKMVFIAVFLVIFDIVLLKGDNAGGHFAHVGGAIYGFIYGYNLRKGKNLAEKISNIIAKLFSLDFTPKSKARIIKNNLRTKDDLRYNATKQDIKKEVDRILDKISQNGYQSLSKKEKDFLNKFGKDI
ncbi:MAG: rhomboid family intramembrane serine protease [Bacteroidales bacterium]|nr:rhomboid family intramembrane serine protease [Bacteroidales bacterium]